MNSRNDEQQDAGAPLPDFRAPNIKLQTIAPALGVTGGHSTPDYLEIDAGGRGLMVTMFANAGTAYLMGIGGGGFYGFRQGLAATPSNRFRVQLNSVLNHTGRYGSRAGNTLGVVSVLYSLYEGVFDHVSVGSNVRRRRPNGTLKQESCAQTVRVPTPTRSPEEQNLLIPAGRLYFHCAVLLDRFLLAV